MRRQMMKQPSGQVVSASPTPARMARTKKSSSMAALPTVGMGVRVLMSMMTIMIMSMVVPVIMRVMPVIGVAMVGHRTVGMLHAPIRQMRMVVMMAVDGKRLRRAAAEQTHIFRAAADGFGRAAAADMAAEADDRVRSGPGDVGVV